MLKFEQSQFEAIRRRRRAEFAPRLSAWLVSKHAAGEIRASDGNDFDAVANEAVDVCSSFGIAGEADVASFALRLLRHGSGFVSRPENRDVLEILQDPAIPGNSKMSTLRRMERAKEALRSDQDAFSGVPR